MLRSDIILQLADMLNLDNFFGNAKLEGGKVSLHLQTLDLMMLKAKQATPTYLNTRISGIHKSLEKYQEKKKNVAIANMPVHKEHYWRNSLKREDN